MKNYRFILIAFLVGITLFSAVQYILALREKIRMQGSLTQARAQVTALEAEKQALLQDLEKALEVQKQLSQENTGLKQGLKEEEARLARVKNVFYKAYKGIESLNAKLNLLKAENAALKEEKANFDTKFAQMNKQVEDFRVKFSSITELKKAIKELKTQMQKVGIQIIKKADKDMTLEGNRGYLLEKGKPTYPAKVKIEVAPAPAAESKPAQ